MKIIALITVLVALTTPSFAGQIDQDLQAVVLNTAFATAASDANIAVAQKGPGFVGVLGETSRVAGHGPEYFFYIPVKAVRVPLSPLKPTLLGHIVAQLETEPNAPVPLVRSVYFKSVGIPPTE